MAPERYPQARPAPSGSSLARVVFGIPLSIEAFGEGIELAIVEASSTWRGATGGAEPPLDLRIAVDARLSGTSDAEIAVSGDRLTLTGGGVSGHADAANRSASCVVSQDYLRAPELLRERVLEPLVLFLATRNGRTPFHASGFVLHGLAVLLAGPSGAGKSCLALAADRAGYPVLSDDTVYIQHFPELGIWGMPTAAHLLPDDSGDARAGQQRLRGGRLKHVIPFRSAVRQDAVCIPRATVCILKRGTEPALLRLDQRDALSRLDRLDSGFDLIRGRVAEACAALTSMGAWELTLSTDPGEAISLISKSLPLLRQTAVP